MTDPAILAVISPLQLAELDALGYEIVRRPARAGPPARRWPWPRRANDAIDAVCAAAEIPRGRLLGEDRCRDAAWPRQVAMFLARRSGLTLSQIGRMFGRDHTTVLHACGAVSERLARVCETTTAVYEAARARLGDG